VTILAKLATAKKIQNTRTRTKIGAPKMVFRLDQLAKVDTSGFVNSAYIHNLAAVTVSKDCPISASSIIEIIPSALEKILK
jgi:hypothetical protein